MSCADRIFYIVVGITFFGAIITGVGMHIMGKEKK